MLQERFVKPLPKRLIGDKTYDSDPLGAKLKEKGVEMIAPHRKNRKKKKVRGRKETQTLQEALESGTLLCLAFQLQKNLGQAGT